VFVLACQRPAPAILAFFGSHLAGIGSFFMLEYSNRFSRASPKEEYRLQAKTGIIAQGTEQQGAP
jgi:hypothetical protein